MSAPARAEGGSQPESVDDLASYAASIKSTNPSEYAVLEPDVQRLVRRKRVAWGFLVGGFAVGGALAGTGVAMANAMNCDAMPEESVQQLLTKANCYDARKQVLAPWLGAGITAMVGGVVTYFVAKPSKEDVQKVLARHRARWLPNIAISADPTAGRYMIGMTASF